MKRRCDAFFSGPALAAHVQHRADARRMRDVGEQPLHRGTADEAVERTHAVQDERCAGRGTERTANRRAAACDGPRPVYRARSLAIDERAVLAAEVGGCEATLTVGDARVPPRDSGRHRPCPVRRSRGRARAPSSRRVGNTRATAAPSANTRTNPGRASGARGTPSVLGGRVAGSTTERISLTNPSRWR